MTGRRVVFDRWLTGFRRRVAVWRVVRARRRDTSAMWAPSERAAITREMGRIE